VCTWCNRCMLRDEVAATLAEMKWLGPADRAMRALALKLAEEIDSARARAEEFGELDGSFGPDEDEFHRLKRLEAWCDVAKMVGMLGPRLRDVLKDLGGTPATRKGIGGTDPDAGRASRVTGLRSLNLVSGGQQ